MVRLKKTVIHQRQISGHHCGAGKSPPTIAEEGRTVDTDGEEKESRRKDTVIFLTGGGEATNPDNIEALYAFVRSWGTEEEDDIPFTD